MDCNDILQIHHLKNDIMLIDEVSHQILSILNYLIVFITFDYDIRSVLVG